MYWAELAFAAVLAVAFTVSHFDPWDWGDRIPLRVGAGIVVVVTAMFYLALVDDERRPKAGAIHRMVVGGATGLIVAAIACGDGEWFFLLGLVGVMAGYVGFRWLEHVL